MAKPMSSLSKFIIIVLVFILIIKCLGCVNANEIDVASTWAKTTAYGHERKTILQFYFHDKVSGNSPTSIQIIPPSKPNKSYFGMVSMVDDALTIGPNPKSKLVGRAQGLYGLASQDYISLIMAMSYNFIDGIYNGSSLSILGPNSSLHPVREMAVVGGTGVFRMARGYAEARKYWSGADGDAIVGYNVTIVH